MNAHKVKLPATTIYMKFGGKKSRVKLNRGFFPRRIGLPRSEGCGFALQYTGTVVASLIHSCASQLDDEAFGYLKRVIVTPAVDECLTLFLENCEERTEQKSRIVKIFSKFRFALF